jgi:hypothetical protein
MTARRRQRGARNPKQPLPDGHPLLIQALTGALGDTQTSEDGTDACPMLRADSAERCTGVDVAGAGDFRLRVNRSARCASDEARRRDLSCAGTGGRGETLAVIASSATPVPSLACEIAET